MAGNYERSPKKHCSQQNNVQENSKQPELSFTPREYQIEILEDAKKRNTIACLGTGTGKTFIAVMLIREMSHLVLKPLECGGKKIFFIVPTVPLVHQQAKVIREHTELEIGSYYGEMSVDTWKQEEWDKEFEKMQVLVMTAEICRIILDHCFLPVSSICLMVFDECHQARKNSPYHEVMRHISSSKSEKPRIFGLSASLLNGKCPPSKVQKELAELEYNMKSTITTSSDYNEVQKYGTDPDEILVLYHDMASSYKDSTFSILNEMQELSLKLKQNEASEPKDLSEVSFFRRPGQCIRQLIDMMQNLGPWCAWCATKMFCKDIKKLLLYIKEDALMNSIREVKHTLDMFVEHLTQHYRIDVFSCSHKLKKLQEIFRAMNSLHGKSNSSGSGQNNPSTCLLESPVCLVFVKERIVASVLCQWIQGISQETSEFSHLIPDFIVGHGSTGQSELSNMSVSKQEEVIKRFRERSFNVLIATSVLEEGMDIQKCNVVIRFDVPQNFRSYVQSKGRARAPNSKYVVLLPAKEKVMFLEDMCTFKTIEKLLTKMCQDREEPDENMDQEVVDSLLPCYQPLTDAGSPRITLSSAISIVNRYCSKLPCDRTTKLTANWKIDVSDPGSAETYFKCTLRLPINSALREPVVGKAMKKKKYAKMAAALEACKLLHEKGELSKHLLPMDVCVDEEAEDLGMQETEDTGDGAKQGTNKRRQYYKKGTASVIVRGVPSSQTTFFVHAIVMDLVIPLPDCLNPRKRPILNPAASSRGFGLLTNRQLPKVPKFPIFTKVGKICVSLESCPSPVHLSSDQLSAIERFHKFLFDDTLQLVEKEMQFSFEASCFPTLVVPINKTDASQYYLDWDFLTYTLQHDYHVLSQKSFEESERTVFSEDVFTDAVLSRMYITKCNPLCEQDVTQNLRKFYVVKNIDYSLTINDALDCATKYDSFKEYYSDYYDIEIQNEKQPMLEVDEIPSLNFVIPIYTKVQQMHQTLNLGMVSKSKEKRAKYKVFLVPELCLRHPLNGSLFRKLCYLPSMLYRLNHLLLSEELRASVGIGPTTMPESFQWPVFNFERSDKDLMAQLREQGVVPDDGGRPVLNPVDVVKSDGVITSYYNPSDLRQSAGPYAGDILQAQTTTSAGDEFNLERLETIGDSFLKYVMSVIPFVNYPEFDEGKLTQLRSQLICNSNLYALAKKKGLGEFLVHTPFIVRQNWLPPCYSLDETERLGKVKSVQRKDLRSNEEGESKELSKNPKESSNTYYTFQHISDKNVADSVEALIGVYLLSCGQEGALLLMSWLGYRIPKSWPPVSTPVDTSSPSHQVQLSQYLEGLEMFQQRIGYKFKEPAYLLQAFTHASYIYNEVTNCYQRLEFLGDAVIDFLITRHLYDSPQEHSPGQLTDLRSALVNNSYFASVAAALGFHKNLKCLSVTLCKQIDAFISKLNASKEFKIFQECGYYMQEQECFDLEEVEVPKALGDVFESVAGAIYLDSGMSLDVVWSIYYPIMKPSIDHLSKYIPKQPVRDLLERISVTRKKDIFTFVECEGDFRCIAKLPSGEEFSGRGPNKRVAKLSAAKRALSFLRARERNYQAVSNH